MLKRSLSRCEGHIYVDFRINQSWTIVLVSFLVIIVYRRFAHSLRAWRHRGLYCILVESVFRLIGKIALGSIPSILLIGFSFLLLTFMKVLTNYQTSKFKTRNRKKNGDKPMKINDFLTAALETLWGLVISNLVGALST